MSTSPLPPVVQRVFDLQVAYLKRGLAPGMNLAIWYDQRWHTNSTGTISSGVASTNDHVLYDLASVTKLVTALQILELAARAKLLLTSKISTYLPYLEPLPLTVEECLMHRGKICLVRRYNKNQIYSRQDLEKFFLRGENLYVERPGDYNYGDTGYLYLGLLVEHITGTTLEMATTQFCARNKLPEIMYNPLQRAASPCTVAPSQKDVETGLVQDEKARWYGGACGHAGLFGSAYGLMSLAKALLNEQFALPGNNYNLLYNPYFPVSPKTGMSFSVGGIRRGLFSSAPNITGYSGCGLFLWPVTNMAIICTTNITYPTRKQDRSLYHEFSRALGSIGDGP